MTLADATIDVKMNLDNAENKKALEKETEQMSKGYSKILMNFKKGITGLTKGINKWATPLQSVLQIVQSISNSAEKGIQTFQKYEQLAREYQSGASVSGTSLKKYTQASLVAQQFGIENDAFADAIKTLTEDIATQKRGESVPFPFKIKGKTNDAVDTIASLLDYSRGLSVEDRNELLTRFFGDTDLRKISSFFNQSKTFAELFAQEGKIWKGINVDEEKLTDFLNKGALELNRKEAQISLGSLSGMNGMVNLQRINDLFLQRASNDQQLIESDSLLKDQIQTQKGLTIATNYLTKAIDEFLSWVVSFFTDSQKANRKTDAINQNAYNKMAGD